MPRKGRWCRDGVHVEFIRGDLEVAAAFSHQGDGPSLQPSAIVRPRSVSPAGDQHLHCHDSSCSTLVTLDHLPGGIASA